MQKHLKDYVWMRLPNEAPIQVPADLGSLTPKLAEGYVQVDEPATAETPAPPARADQPGAKFASEGSN